MYIRIRAGEYRCETFKNMLSDGLSSDLLYLLLKYHLWF